jgi:hypothetical protein
MWSMRNPDGPPMPQTFGSSLDRADDARKEAKMHGEYVDRAECPSCGRATRMLAAFGECPYADCRHGRSTA